MPTIDHIRAGPCLWSSVPLRAGLRSIWSCERSAWVHHVHPSLPRFSPPPPDFPLHPRHENPSYSSMQPEPKPEHTRGAAVGSPAESGTFARQRRRTSDNSTVGDMSIDWIVPESSTVSPRDVSRLSARASIRTTQTPKSATVVCGSIAEEVAEVAHGGKEHAMTRSARCG